MIRQTHDNSPCLLVGSCLYRTDSENGLQNSGKFYRFRPIRQSCVARGRRPNAAAAIWVPETGRRRRNSPQHDRKTPVRVRSLSRLAEAFMDGKVIVVTGALGALGRVVVDE